VPNYFEKEGSFVYKRIPVYDASTSASALLGCSDDIVDYIAKGLCHGSVLVHCNMGQSRSTTAAIFFLVRYDIRVFIRFGYHNYSCLLVFPWVSEKLAAIYLHVTNSLLVLSIHILHEYDRKENMSWKAALEIIQRRRPAADPIPAFREILAEFESKCHKERQAGDNSTRADKNKRVVEEGTRDPSEKRRRLGPTMPSSIRICEDGQVAPAPMKRNIGPALPPFLADGNPEGSPDGQGAPAPVKKSIGPALPPALDEDKPEEDSPVLPQAPKKSIGPSLPPSR
jgi:hypothetical protein